MFEQNKNNINLLILICGSIIFLFKWYLSFYNFVEDISTKIIFESTGDGYEYFPFIKFLSDFDFFFTFQSHKTSNFWHIKVFLNRNNFFTSVCNN